MTTEMICKNLQGMLDDPLCHAEMTGWQIVAVNEAIAALRALQERENPKPLTLDELREMDQNSPPIWDSCLNEWCAVRWIAAAGCKGVSYIGRGSRQLESGRFFRQKPKEV